MTQFFYRWTDRAERATTKNSRAGGDDVEDSHIWAGRVVSTSSHRRSLSKQSRVCTLQCKGGRVGRDIDFDVESDVDVIDDVEITDQEDT